MKICAVQNGKYWRLAPASPNAFEITDEQYAVLLVGTHRISDDGSGGGGGGVQTTTYKAAA